jgi:deoxyribose-phosphate aldolase
LPIFAAGEVTTLHRAREMLGAGAARIATREIASVVRD